MKKPSEHFVSKLIEWGHHIKAIAQTGLSFSDDFYNQSRYQDLQRIASEILSSVNGKLAFEPKIAERLGEILEKDVQSGIIGYITPKVSVAAAVFNAANQLLLVKPNDEMGWCLPGGWADELWIPSENAQREVFEETGLEIKIQQLLGVFDSRRHPFNTTVPSYTLLFASEMLDGVLKPQKIEIESACFFDEDNLPKIILGSQTQVEISYLWKKGELQEPFFDN